MARVLAVLAVFAVVAAGSTAAHAAEADNSKGTRQVVFSFNGWNLGSYDGGIGLRYFVRDDVAIRPGLDFSYSDRDEEKTYAESEGMRSDSIDADSRGIGLSFLVEKYVSGYRTVSPFLALGLAYSYSSGDNREDYYDHRYQPVSRYWSDRDRQHSHQVSLFGALGFQWDFTEHLSLGGQYNLGVNHQWGHEDGTHIAFNGYETDLEITRRDWESTAVNVDAARLVLSVRL